MTEQMEGVNTHLVGALLERIRGRTKHKWIVVIGDAITDRWVHGRVTECQDGCRKFIEESIIDTPGGAANAQRCLDNWTASVELFGYNESDRPVKRRYMVDGKIIFRSDDDEIRKRHEYVFGHSLALEMIPHAAGVLLSDYDKGFLTPDYIKEVVARCQSRCTPVVADCKRSPEVYQGCILKGNKEWRQKYDIREMPARYVITQGDGPPYGYELDRAWTLNPGIEVPCINHVGAGDCFAAHLTLALAHGFSLIESAKLANCASRVYVQYPHNRPPTIQEIAADLLVNERQSSAV